MGLSSGEIFDLLDMKVHPDLVILQVVENSEEEIYCYVIIDSICKENNYTC